ncbi:electron transfer flavoprotein subunit beta/FixA family protein [Microbacterium sp. NPDC096154]|uniref:electron transfer flavoprotein subunit beta/FixA family protein n=1 Tax=Microbacterium sp. NPDC096154 TaxID=3155549 RepID=UPI00331831E4
MKIVVLMKEVPDTYGDRMLDLETGLADRGAGDRVLDEITERALEAALAYADAAGDAEVIVMSMGPEEASAAIRKGLAMGAARAVQIVDEDLVGADLTLTAEVLAAALTREGYDLVLAGNVSTDGSGGMLPAMVAELLGVPQVTGLSDITITADSVSGTRRSDAATLQVTAPLPAVASVTEALPDARFPNFKGIMAAKKKPFDTVSLADLGVIALSPEAPRAIMTAVSAKPPRAAGVKVVDEGDAAQQLADFLVSKKLV